MSKIEKTNAVQVTRDGIIKEVEPPKSGFGKMIITWQGGKPCTVKLETDIKL